MFVSACVCFFKQKTAYEMRISDWSSDVCSSDLFATKEEWLANAIADGVNQSTLDFIALFNQLPVLELTGVEYGQTFDPEFVDAFEIGAKNSLDRKSVV